MRAVTGAAATGDVEALREVLARAAGRVAELFRSAPAPDRRVPGSEWTVGDVAAHLASGVDAYAGYLAGSTEPRADVSDLPGGSLAASNAANLATVADRDVDRLAGQIRSGAGGLVAAVAGRDGPEPVFWHGRTVALSTFLASAVAELLVHGLDVARALRRPWPIEREDARLVDLALVPLLPLLVHPERAKGVTATYELRFRGGGRATLAFRDGDLDASVGAAERADCRIGADPVAFLLVAYGRRSQWSAIAGGRLTAWGRRPWLALRLTGMLVTP